MEVPCALYIFPEMYNLLPVVNSRVVVEAG
jgi:hypothetical protein